MKKLLSFLAILVLSLAVVFSVTACDMVDIDGIRDEINNVIGGELGNLDGSVDSDSSYECEHTPFGAVQENYVAATCTTDGRYDSVVYCGGCDAELSRNTVIISAPGHTTVETIENRVEPTCTVNGSYETVVCCTVCDSELSRDVNTIIAPGHGDTVTRAENRVEYTCTADGYYDTVVYCAVCNDEIFRERVILPAAHHLSMDVCIECGQTVSSEGLIFTLNPDGESYTVTGIGTFTGEYLVIGTYKNLPVTDIASSAFADCTDILSVNVSDCVTSIGSMAFSGCENLRYVSIGSNVSDIHATAFYGHTKIHFISVNGDNAYYQSINGDLYTKDGKTLVKYALGKTDTSFTVPDCVTTVGSYAFQYCSSLNRVIIPSNVTEIENGAFSYCDNLSFVSIGNGVTSIGTYAFFECTGLTSMIIGNSLTSIGEGAFAWCERLVSIKYRGTESQWNAITKNEIWDDRAGDYTVMYNYGVLVSSPGLEYTLNDDGKSYTVTGIGNFAGAELVIDTYNGLPVTAIASFAFEYANIRSLTIGNSVTSIGNFAFWYCANLTTLTVGEGVTNIGTNAFCYCESLANIRYAGTRTQWKAITKGNLWDYGNPWHIFTYNYTGE